MQLLRSAPADRQAYSILAPVIAAAVIVEITAIIVIMRLLIHTNDKQSVQDVVIGIIMEKLRVYLLAALV